MSVVVFCAEHEKKFIKRLILTQNLNQIYRLLSVAFKSLVLNY